MAFKNKYFKPDTYYYKVIIICILMAADIIFSSFTQFINYGSSKVLTKYNIRNVATNSPDLAWSLVAYI